MVNETYKLDLTIGQIRVLCHVLEHYIRNHDIILHNSKLSISEMKLIFADLSRYCELCKTLSDILNSHNSQPHNEDK